MAQMIRTTVIGLLNKDIRLEDLQRFIEEKMAESAFSGFKTIQGFSNTEDGEPRRYVKFRKLFEIDPLDHRWNLNPFHEFARAGYGEVAWKFTKLEEIPFSAQSPPNRPRRRIGISPGSSPINSAAPAPAAARVPPERCRSVDWSSR